MSNIVLDTLTYVGEGIVNGISRFVERSAGLAAYFGILTSSVTVNTKADRVNVNWKLTKTFPAAPPAECPCPGESPYIDTIVDIRVRMDARAPLAYRENVVDELQSLVLTSQFTDSIEQLVNPS